MIRHDWTVSVTSCFGSADDPGLLFMVPETEMAATERPVAESPGKADEKSRGPRRSVTLDVSGGFSLRRVERAARMAQGHVHGDIEVNFLRQGAMRYLIAGRLVQVRAGEALVLWAGLPHEMVHLDGRIEGVWATVPLAVATGWSLPRDLLSQLMGGRVIVAEISERGSCLAPTALDRWLEDVASGAADRLACVRLELQAWFRRLAVHLPAELASGRAPGAEAALGAVGRALQYIHRHYTEDLDLPRIAAAAELHPKSLVRAFRRVTVYTPWEYVLRMRVAHAQSLLASSDQPVLQVALASGFESLAPFYQAFRRWTDGQTPRQFRLALRGQVGGATRRAARPAARRSNRAQ
jgi:AraC family transcriptional regulator, melibiose operon regulatory protein